MRLAPQHLRWIAILAAVAVVVGQNLATQPWTLDDAYISFRYAENLLEGNGLVYNPGERVEGYTNFLWVMLVAGLAGLGLNMVVAAKSLGAALMGGTILLMGFSDRIVPDLDPKVAALMTVLAGTFPVLTRWSMSGMEVPLVVFLTLAALLVHLRSRALPEQSWLGPLSGVLAAMAMMTRPDAGLVFGVMWLDRVWHALPIQQSPDTRPRRFRALLALTVSFIAAYAPYYAWRFDYYGWPLPNTFYVKVGSTSHQVIRGMWYIGDFVEVGGLMLIVAGVAALLVRRLPALPGQAAVIAFVLGHLAYIFAVGGDVFWGFRFFAVVMPLAALFTARLILHILPAGPARVASITVFVAINLANVAFHPKLTNDSIVSSHGLETGAWFGEHAPPDAVLATNIAGSIPWVSGLVTIDTLGLNDVHIAHKEMRHMGRGRAGHEKGDGAYVLSREPDYVLFGSSKGARRPRFVGDRQLYENEDFHEQYALRVYETEQGRRLWVYVRRQSFGGKDLQARPLVVGVNPFAKGRLRLPGGEEEEVGGDIQE
jgi:arabinofuranosyltransferase